MTQFMPSLFKVRRLKNFQLSGPDFNKVIQKSVRKVAKIALKNKNAYSPYPSTKSDLEFLG